MSKVVDETIELLKKELAKKVIAALVARSSFFSSWLISPILSFFIPIIINELWDFGAFNINWLWATIENKSELAEALKTKEALATLLGAGKDTTQAEKEFDAATNKLIHNKFNRIPR